MKRDNPGTVLAGKYELVRVAGRGGMALVWQAKMRQGGKERPVAVKRMLVNDRDHEFAELFREEARVGLQLKHPNIVQVLDFGASEKDGYFLVMEWVEGIDLLDLMRAYHADKRHMPWQVVAAVGQGVCLGLAGAHELVDAEGRSQPVIHRDLTPGNILLGVEGVVKIADFGLARATDRGSMTMPNTIKGKLTYTAPELAAGERATVRSDIFGLGVTLWECLAARKLFSGKSNLEVIQAIYRWNIPALAPLRPDIPFEMVEIATRAIARSPVSRFGSAREMGEALGRLLSNDPVDAARLGAAIRAARARLQELDGGPTETLEDSSILEDAMSAPKANPAPPARRWPPPPPPPTDRPPAPLKPSLPKPPAFLGQTPPPTPAPKTILSLARRAPPPALSTKPTLSAPKALDPAMPTPAPDQSARRSPETLGRVGGQPTPPPPPIAPLARLSEPPPPPIAPLARLISEPPPCPAIRDNAPHEALHLSFSDLFEAGIKADLDAQASPASSRMARRSAVHAEVLDHESSWDLPADPPPPKRNPG